MCSPTYSSIQDLIGLPVKMPAITSAVLNQFSPPRVYSISKRPLVSDFIHLSNFPSLGSAVLGGTGVKDWCQCLNISPNGVTKFKHAVSGEQALLHSRFKDYYSMTLWPLSLRDKSLPATLKKGLFYGMWFPFCVWVRSWPWISLWNVTPASWGGYGDWYL